MVRMVCACVCVCVCVCVPLLLPLFLILSMKSEKNGILNPVDADEESQYATTNNPPSCEKKLPVCFHANKFEIS
jgi:hypothetical protein